MMQVACGQCGATYEFEATAIPADGYDAQCTTCGNVFFVAPERSPALVSVACSRCRTVYQFGASDIPAGGYDAQCTQCGAVFFVSATGAPETAPADGAEIAAASPAPPPSPALPEYAMPAGTPMDDVAQAAAATGARAPAASAAPPAGAPGTAGGLEPAAAATAGDLLAVTRRGRRRRLALVVAVSALVAAGLVVYFFLGPFAGSVARLAGTPPADPPEVLAAVERARRSMLADIAPAYEQALAELGPVLQRHPGNPEATALAALVHVFRGFDLRADAERERARAASLVEEGKAAKARRDSARFDAARAGALAHEQRRRELRDAAAGELGRAFAMLEPALDEHRASASLALAAGFYYAAEPSTSGKAEELLARSVELRSRPGVRLDPAVPADALTGYLRARLWMAQPGDRRRVRDALEGALALEPALQRARYELAGELVLSGENAEARKHLTVILEAIPQHTRAAQRLAALDAPVPPAAAAVAEGGTTAKGKKRKGKRKR